MSCAVPTSCRRMEKSLINKKYWKCQTKMAFEAIMGIVMFYLNPKPHLLHRRSVDLLQPPSEKVLLFTYQRQACSLPSLMHTNQTSSLLMNYTVCFWEQSHMKQSVVWNTDNVTWKCVHGVLPDKHDLHKIATLPSVDALRSWGSRFFCNMRKSTITHTTHLPCGQDIAIFYFWGYAMVEEKNLLSNTNKWTNMFGWP